MPHRADSNDEQDERQDPLWDLLGKVERPRPSLRFTQDVLRAVREESTKRSSWPHWFSWHRLSFVTAAAGAAVIVIGATLLLVDQPSELTNPALASAELFEADAVAAAEDFEVISELDLLLASEENQVWIAEAAFH